MINKMPFVEGRVLMINKPLHWTSFDVVKKIRGLIKIKKIGHAGTLDPLATGLLILCTGKFTKKINEYMGMEKEYQGTITIGATTPTFDLESEPENQKDISHISAATILQTTKKFIGNILQIPPQHSAIKKDGKRLYESARQGIKVEVEPRSIIINEFQISKIEGAIIHFKVVCSTGTYIRSLANDFGEALGVGGYLSSLCRTKIGNFNVIAAQSIEDFEKELKSMREYEIR